MIYIGSDHGGYETKEVLKEYLSNLGYTLEDIGNSTFDQTDDYPKYAIEVGEKVVQNKGSKGILICTSGIGVSVACNKVKGAICAKVDNEEEASKSRQHNDANVIALDGLNAIEKSKKLVRIFLESEFSNEERHIRRNEQIKKYENEH